MILFSLILTLAVVISGLISLADILFFAKNRIAKGIVHPNKLIEYSRSLFPILLLVLIIRSFIVQPFRVPSGSLEPTVLPGELMAVNQFAYGLHLPITNTKVLPIGEPKTGQIVVFFWPVDPKIVFVKRVIGTPGDHIVYHNKILSINGQIASQTYIGAGVDQEPGDNIPVQEYEENLNGVKHKIFVNPAMPDNEDIDLVVPPGYYFMMGDNRDNSGDSRSWGFVPEADLIGQAFLVFLSWDSQTHSVRWHRIGTVI